MKNTLMAVAVVTLFICFGASQASHQFSRPMLQASQIVTTPGGVPSTDSDEHSQRVWPMLGLSAIIAAGGLALVRRIAGTIS